MTGIEKAREMIEKYSNRPILVYGDPDVDGLMAMLLVCQFLDMRKRKYSYFINEHRHHGLTLTPAALKGYFVIAVDFSISEKEMQDLVDGNVAVLSLDHHNIQPERIDCKNEALDTEGFVINNQYPFEPEDNTYQSGAGVVYETLSEAYPEFKSDDREAIVGITLLSDTRPIENDKARAYLKKTYNSDPQTGYTGYLVENVIDKDYGFGLPRLDRNFIDYTFSPRVNSMLRFGQESEAMNFILGKGIKKSDDTHGRQTALLEAMRNRASVLELSDLTVVGVDANSFSDFPNVDITGFIGLLCSNIKGTGKSVLGFVYDNGEITRASFRGRFDDVHYRSGLVNMGINAQGHQAAFGILDFEPTEDTWNEINELVMQLDEGHEIQAHIVDASNLSFVLLQRGMSIATENCYVRDMFRTYIRYTGSNAKVIKETYKLEKFSPQDYKDNLEPVVKQGTTFYKYALDAAGNKIPKYIEYLVDGKQVKSFGVRLEDGLILPMLDKGHVQLYVREMIY